MKRILALLLALTAPLLHAEGGQSDTWRTIQPLPAGADRGAAAPAGLAWTRAARSSGTTSIPVRVEAAPLRVNPEAGAYSDIELVAPASYTYDFQNGIAHFAVAGIRNTSSTTTSGSLRLELWATPAPYTGGALDGYRISTYRLGGPDAGTLPASASFSDASADALVDTVPPAGMYYAYLVVSEYSASCVALDGFCLADYLPMSPQLAVPYAGPPSSSAAKSAGSAGNVEITGTYSNQTDFAANTTTFYVERITNVSGNRRTGSLRLELWLTTEPYGGASISGYRIAVAPLAGVAGSNGTLEPGYSFTNVTGPASLQNLPAGGAYHATLIVGEYTNGCGTDDGYCIAAYGTYDSPIVVPAAAPISDSGGSGGGALDPMLLTLLALSATIARRRHAAHRLAISHANRYSGSAAIRLPPFFARAALFLAAVFSGLCHAATALDSTFGNQGAVRFPDREIARCAADLASRRLICALDDLNANSVGLEVSALSPDGTIDISFGNAGRAQPEAIQRDGDGAFLDERPTAIAVQPDGKILVAGYSEDPDNLLVTGTPIRDVFVLRLNADGSLDETFVRDRIKFKPGSSDYLRKILLLPSGDILVVGDSRYVIDPNGNPLEKSAMAVAMLNSNGLLVVPYGIEGKQLVEYDRVGEDSGIGSVGRAFAYDAEVANSSNVYLIGNATTPQGSDTCAVAVLDSTGRILFRRTIPLGGSPAGCRAGAFLPDQTLVVAGYSGSPSTAASVARLSYPDPCCLDPGFGTHADGILRPFGTDQASQATDISIDGSSILVFGWKRSGTDSNAYRANLLRADVAGQPSPDFGDNGLFQFTFIGAGMTRRPLDIVQVEDSAITVSFATTSDSVSSIPGAPSSSTPSGAVVKITDGKITDGVITDGSSKSSGGGLFDLPAVLALLTLCLSRLRLIQRAIRGVLPRHHGRFRKS